MKVKAIAFRILNELRHDKRSLMLIFVAPLLLLTLVFFILDNPDTSIRVAAVNCPQSYIDQLYENNVRAERCTISAALEGLDRKKYTAAVSLESGKLIISIDGSNAAKAEKTLTLLQSAQISASKASLGSQMTQRTPSITYVYGADGLSAFNNMGSTLIGVLVFLFVFLLAGISFLKEKTGGTMEKLLSTPIKRWEIVTGYALGFGLVTAVQAALVTVYVIYVLDVMMTGSIWLVLLTTLLTSLTAVTLGILMSTAASNEFQMVQFVPLIVVPQVFFCGLFDLSPAWSVFGKAMPLYYTADALNRVMLRRGNLLDIWQDLVVLAVCSLIFYHSKHIAFEKISQNIMSA